MAVITALLLRWRVTISVAKPVLAAAGPGADHGKPASAPADQVDLARCADWARLVLRQDGMDSPNLHTSLTARLEYAAGRDPADQPTSVSGYREKFSMRPCRAIIDATSRYNLTNLANDRTSINR